MVLAFESNKYVRRLILYIKSRRGFRLRSRHPITHKVKTWTSIRAFAGFKDVNRSS
jgi:hypothetical protein